MSHMVSRRTRTAGALTAAILVIGALAGCDGSTYSLTLPSSFSLSSPPSPPEQVRADAPRVTYNYRGDEGSVQAGQSATAFCHQYQSQARLSHKVDEFDGTTTAEFECVPSPVVAAPMPAPPSLSYLYRNAQELLDATRNAQSLCAPSAVPMTSTITVDSDGNHTVTFLCGRG